MSVNDCQTIFNRILADIDNLLDALDALTSKEDFETFMNETEKQADTLALQYEEKWDKISQKWEGDNNG